MFQAKRNAIIAEQPDSILPDLDLAMDIDVGETFVPTMLPLPVELRPSAAATATSSKKAAEEDKEEKGDEQKEKMFVEAGPAADESEAAEAAEDGKPTSNGDKSEADKEEEGKDEGNDTQNKAQEATDNGESQVKY